MLHPTLQADDLLIELTTRSGDMLAKIFQQNLDQILGLTVELLHVGDVVIVDTLVELRTTGELMHDMIEHLQNRSKVFMHLRQNLFLRRLLLGVQGLFALRKSARPGGEPRVARPAKEDPVASCLGELDRCERASNRSLGARGNLKL